MTRPTVVIDTNVVVSGLITEDAQSPTARILDAMLTGRLTFLLSVDLLAEYRSVLGRPALRKLHGLTVAQVDRILTDIAGNGIFREPAVEASEGPSRGDAHLWRLLASEIGAILVTGDALLLQKPPPGASVISPRSWVDLHDAG